MLWNRCSEYWRGWFAGSLCGMIFVWLLLAYGPMCGLPHVSY
jgi:hypothetical protein